MGKRSLANEVLSELRRRRPLRPAVGASRRAPAFHSRRQHTSRRMSSCRGEQGLEAASGLSLWTCAAAASSASPIPFYDSLAPCGWCPNPHTSPLAYLDHAHSCSDHMVPWHEGAALCDSLSRAGVPHKHLIYNHVLHSDFALAWPPLSPRQLASVGVGSAGAAGAAADTVRRRRRGLQPFVHDLLRLVQGDVDARATCSPSGAVPRL